MVKKTILSLTLLVNCLSADSNIYEKNCVKCHKKTPIKLGKCFNKYLLSNPSEKELKEVIIKYLQNPDINNTIMSDAVIKRHGVKKKSKLSEKELREAVDIYWEKYQISKKLK